MSRNRDRLKYLAGLLLLGAIYFVAGRIGLTFAGGQDNVTLIWPPTGIAVAAVWLFGYRVWPGLAIGAFLVNVSTEAPIGFVVATMVGNPLQALGATYLLRRFTPFDGSFGRVQNVLQFAVFGVAISPVISATIGSTGLYLTGLANWPFLPLVWFDWWLGDAMGVMLVAPFLLTLNSWPDAPWRPGYAVEGLVLIGCIVLVSTSIYGNLFGIEFTGPLSYLAIPLVIWAGFRFGQCGVATATIVVSAIAVWITANGQGPFAQDTVDASLVSLHGYLSVLALVGMLLAAALAERRRALTTAESVQNSLEQAVEARTAEISTVNAQLSAEIDQRNRTEQALRESEERFRGVVEHSPSAIFLKDTEGRFVLVNKRFEEWYGQSVECVVDKTSHDIFPREYADAYVEQDHAVLNSMRTVEKEHAIIFANGALHQILVTKFPIIGADGNVSGVGTINTDITELKMREKALTESQAALAKAQQIAKVGNWRWSVDGNQLVSCSDEYARIFGATADEIQGLMKEFTERVVHPDDRDRVLRTLKHADEEGSNYQIEYRIIRRDGEVRHVVELGEAVLDETGRTTEHVGTLQDITERKKAELALVASEERLKQAVQLAGLGFYVWDATEDKCIYCSQEHARIYGTTVEDFIARSSALDGPFLFTHPEDREQARAAFKALRAGQRFEMEYRVITPSGETRHIREITKPVFDQSGSVIREYGTVQDITDLKRAQDRLRQSQKLEALGQLTGGVAHDFNNLLAVIMGNGEILQRQHGEQDERLRSILRAASRGAELTQRLLAFGRRQSLHPQSIDVHALVAEMSEMLHRTLGETIEIRISKTSGLCPVLADPGQLENAILNLALNARDAMPDGGTLTIDAANTELVQDDDAVKSGANPGPYVVLTVRDTGSGIPPDVLKHVFEPFFTSKDAGEGSGLGLSMVYGFVEQSGGHVTIDSEEGRGTLLKLYLPRGESAESTAQLIADEVRTAEHKPNGERIMVVEDNPDVREVAVTLLRILGYDVLDAADGATAIDKLESARPIDLLLCDVVLPGGLAGPEVAERVKRRHPAAKILFMSGYANEGIRKVSRIDHDCELLRKPFHRLELAEKVRAALAKGDGKEGTVVAFEDHLRTRRLN